MESTLQRPAVVAATATPKAETIVYWMVTALFCLQISFTAYAQLRLPQVAEAFTHLGFPDYFRVELSWAKLLGVVLLLRRCLLGSRSGLMPASPSLSPRRSSPTSRSAMARRHGAGRRAQAYSGALVFLLAPPVAWSR